MISKERLEELIEQGAKVWCICDYTYSKSKPNKKIEYYDLSNDNICMSPALFGYYGLRIFNALGYWNDIRFEFLFETKEEAEWYIEFGNIEITEKLCLPNFEELCKDLDGKEGEYVIADPKQFSFYIKKGFIDQILLQTKSEKFNWNLNKENYIYACKFAKRIFLGE